MKCADIREACGRRFVIVTPGIRPADGSRNDQQRVMTPQDAVRGGVDYIVVGRPILEAKDPVAAARAIVADMELAQVAALARGISNSQYQIAKFGWAEIRLLRFPIPKEMMHRAVACADAEAVAQRIGDVAFGVGHCRFDLLALGQIRRDGGGESAAGAVGVFRADARRLERGEIFTVVKNIHGRTFAMAAFDEHGFCAHLDDSFCRFVEFPLRCEASCR